MALAILITLFRYQAAAAGLVVQAKVCSEKCTPVQAIDAVKTSSTLEIVVEIPNRL